MFVLCTKIENNIGKKRKRYNLFWGMFIFSWIKLYGGLFLVGNCHFAVRFLLCTKEYLWNLSILHTGSIVIPWAILEMPIDVGASLAFQLDFAQSLCAIMRFMALKFNKLIKIKYLICRILERSNGFYVSRPINFIIGSQLNTPLIVFWLLPNSNLVLNH